MNQWRAVITFTVAVLALGLSACQPARPAPLVRAAGNEVTVIGTDMKFDPAVIAIPAGQAINVIFDNQGIVEHDLAIERWGFRLQALPGQTAAGTLMVAEPGEYEVICTIQGHKDAGMFGKLVVGGQPRGQVAAPSRAALASAGE